MNCQPHFEFDLKQSDMKLLEVIWCKFNNELVLLTGLDTHFRAVQFDSVGIKAVALNIAKRRILVSRL